MESWYKITDEGVQINIKAVPGASKTGISGIKENCLCVRLTAAPQDGRANVCLREFLAARLGCAKRDVIVKKGEKSRVKTITVPAACADRLEKMITA